MGSRRSNVRPAVGPRAGDRLGDRLAEQVHEARSRPPGRRRADTRAGRPGPPPKSPPKRSTPRSPSSISGSTGSASPSSRFPGSGSTRSRSASPASPTATAAERWAPPAALLLRLGTNLIGPDKAICGRPGKQSSEAALKESKTRGRRSQAEKTRATAVPFAGAYPTGRKRRARRRTETGRELRRVLRRRAAYYLFVQRRAARLIAGPGWPRRTSTSADREETAARTGSWSKCRRAPSWSPNCGRRSGQGDRRRRPRAGSR